MTWRRILLATDGSLGNRQAVRQAVDLARVHEATLTAIYVVDRATFRAIPGDFEWDYLAQALRAEGERALAHVHEAAKGEGVHVEALIEEGHPADAIVERAKEHDLIVMGTLGRTGLAHLLLGSTADRVVRHAPCPVLIVPASG